MSDPMAEVLELAIARGVSLEALSAAIDARRLAQGSAAPAPSSGLTTVDLTLEAAEGAASVEAGAGPPPRPAGASGGAEGALPGLARYEDLGPLGVGGMGEVRRVFDRRLGRTLALKTLHLGAVQDANSIARFRMEAQATAQLEHPGIVPVHELGTLTDGRLWFTMKEVTGQTLSEVIEAAHGAARGWLRPGDEPVWSLRRLVAALRQVCDAVGYAHSRGVVHRDLKPDNIMIGGHGEVLVLDWGLAKLLGRPLCDGSSPPAGPAAVVGLHDAWSLHTRVGQVSGTPAYMPPEQALGRVTEIDQRSDVYALGAILYELLTGRRPYEGVDAMDIVEQVRAGPPPSLRDAALPPSLVAVCDRAMARDPAERFDSAIALAAELQAWLEGARRREDARAVVRKAAAKGPRAAALRARAVALRTEARAVLDAVEDWQPEAAKQAGWRKEDEAKALEKLAQRETWEEEQLLVASLTHAPDLVEAHAALAARYRAAHVAAERERRDPTRSEFLLRQHLDALPKAHPDRVGHLAYLGGDGALSLRTDPPGAEVHLYRYARVHRRLVPLFERRLGVTPLDRVPLPMGSYLCVLRAPGRAEVRYPVCIRRGAHWHGVPPGGDAALAIPLPRVSELDASDCYVPAGWFEAGGDPLRQRSLDRQSVWVDGRILRRFPVTNAEYIGFLDALVAAGQETLALRYAPRERAGAAGEEGALIYHFDGGHFHLQPDADGDEWSPDWPVCMVDWHGARAFAAWEAERTGKPWRLIGELAWEKAARGVDGRCFPWGDGFDPSWTSMRRSHPDGLLPTAVGAFPVDESPYGVRDLAGSMAEWCADIHRDEGPPLGSALGAGPDDGVGETHVLRGGAWYYSEARLRVALRYDSRPSNRYDDVGFRLARSYP